MTYPFVSIIVPTYNRASMLKMTLHSLVSLDYPKDKLEIIIGDNNSNDNTIDILKFFSKHFSFIKFFSEPRQGVHFVRNHAACMSKGDILYFTDDDMKAAPSLLKELVVAFENPKVGCATGKVLPKWPCDNPPQWVLKYMQNGWLSLQDLGEDLIIENYDIGVYSCHEAVRRSVFFKTGGFNPENTKGLWIGDGETGLNKKIENIGSFFAYIPTSITYHVIPYERITQRYIISRMKNQGRSDAYSFYQMSCPSFFAVLKKCFTSIFIEADSFVATFLRIPYYILKRKNDGVIRMKVSRLFYYFSFIKYLLLISSNSKLKEFVLRTDWLSDEINCNSNN